MDQPDLFPLPPGHVLNAEELAKARSAAMSPGIRQHREADLYLATLCAHQVASRLISSGLKVVEPPD